MSTLKMKGGGYNVFSIWMELVSCYWYHLLILGHLPNNINIAGIIKGYEKVVFAALKQLAFLAHTRVPPMLTMTKLECRMRQFFNKHKQEIDL